MRRELVVVPKTVVDEKVRHQTGEAFYASITSKREDCLKDKGVGALSRSVSFDKLDYYSFYSSGRR